MKSMLGGIADSSGKRKSSMKVRFVSVNRQIVRKTNDSMTGAAASQLTIYFDHDNLRQEWRETMEEIAVSEFKAKCLEILKQVQKTKKPLRITRFGKPIAEVVPPSPPPARKNWLGSMSDSFDITGDIVSPASEEGEWEALRD